MDERSPAHRGRLESMALVLLIVTTLTMLGLTVWDRLARLRVKSVLIRVRVGLLIVGFVLMSKGSIVAGSQRESPGRTESIANLLENYSRAEYPDDSTLASVGEVRAVTRELIRAAPKFVEGRPDATHRQQTVAAFALELASVNVLTHPDAAIDLVEWACVRVRANPQPTPFDLQWQLAALSLLEGVVNPAALTKHIEHLGPSLTGHPQVVFARGIAAEQAVAPHELSTRQPVPVTGVREPQRAERSRLVERAIEELKAVSAMPETRGEGALRLAHMYIVVQRYDQALLSLDSVEAVPRDAGLEYLARLFRGLALDGLGRGEDARASYRSALAIAPGHAALMASATSLFLDGQRREAGDLVEQLMADDDPARDTWWSYWEGDFRWWRQRVLDLRASLK